MNEQGKRQGRKRANNPLANARKNDKVESLWHRKSGAGFSLFVEFYASQPLGVCSDGGEPSEIIPLLEKSTSRLPSVGSGQSRASKRRKRKKHPQSAGSMEVSKKDACMVVNGKAGNPSKLPSQDDMYLNTRLLKALSDYDEDGRKRIQVFLTTLSKPLPLTFRIRRTVSKDQENQIRKTLTSTFSDFICESSFDSRIFQSRSSSLSKASLFKVSPALKDFLVTGSLNGSIARQELASMLPILALATGGWIREGSRVLDMCASPGSKTLQALEIVGSTGRVKANDVNPNRLTSLQDAVERSCLSTIRRVKYTNLDASAYPIPTIDKRFFDTVICDVPCSGDGTIRKDPHVLSNWTPAASNALHGLQVKILVRALQCLKIGGVMSYSTCSLNPVENEAVVAAALAKSQEALGKNRGGSRCVELVPWPSIPGLKCHPGVSKWKIADYVGDTEDDEDKARLRWHGNYEEAGQAEMKHAVPSMWPPDQKEQLHLDRCARLWPHDQDTGGFFVALIRRNR